LPSPELRRRILDNIFEKVTFGAANQVVVLFMRSLSAEITPSIQIMGEEINKKNSRNDCKRMIFQKRRSRDARDKAMLHASLAADDRCTR
jgi:hypothetical protein